MHKTAHIAILMVFLATGFAPVSVQQDQDDDLQAALKELNRRYLAEDFPGKADAVEEFLRKYPETRYTVQVLNAAFRLIEHELDDPQRMLELTEYVLKHATQEDLKTEIMTRQIELFIRLEMNDRLLATAQALEASKVEKFAVEEGLGHAYIASGEWGKALAHFQKSLDFATVEALKAEGLWERYGESFRDYYLRGRLTAAHTGIARSLAGLGKLDEALEHYETAAASANTNVFGAAEGELNYLWGLALNKAGRTEEAKRLFAAAALTRKDESAKAELLNSYKEEHGSGEGFDAYLIGLRGELAPAFVDFTLPDYEGENRRFADLKGSAATMIVFWHPL